MNEVKKFKNANYKVASIFYVLFVLSFVVWVILPFSLAIHYNNPFFLWNWLILWIPVVLFWYLNALFLFIGKRVNEDKN